MNHWRSLQLVRIPNVVSLTAYLDLMVTGASVNHSIHKVLEGLIAKQIKHDLIQ
jgi:hypothetical protein